MAYTCDIRQIDARHTLAVRVRVEAADLPKVMGRWFGAIGQYLVELRETPAGMPYAGYFRVNGSSMDVEIGFPVGKPLPGSGEIRPGSFPGGRMAACLHVGPYDQLEAAVNALTAYVATQKLETTGAWYELYLNDPAQVGAEQTQTLVLMPLE